MRAITTFYKRVMDSVEQGKTDDGFFGSAQLVVPASCAGARFVAVTVPRELREQSASLDRFLEATASGVRRPGPSS